MLFDRICSGPSSYPCNRVSMNRGLASPTTGARTHSGPFPSTTKLMSPPSAHSVLGLPYNASKEEVRPEAHETGFAYVHPARSCFHVARNVLHLALSLRSSKHTENCACFITRICLLRTSGSRRRGVSNSSQKLIQSSTQALAVGSRLHTALVQVADRMRSSLSSNKLHVHTGRLMHVCCSSACC